MAFSVKSKKSGKMYYLHTKTVKLAGGRQQKIYYFAGDIRKDALNDLPAGYEIMENKRTGLPMLRKAGGKSTAKTPAKAPAKPAAKPATKPTPAKNTGPVKGKITGNGKMSGGRK